MILSKKDAQCVYLQWIDNLLDQSKSKLLKSKRLRRKVIWDNSYPADIAKIYSKINIEKSKGNVSLILNKNDEWGKTLYPGINPNCEWFFVKYFQDHKIDVSFSSTEILFQWSPPK